MYRNLSSLYYYDTLRTKFTGAVSRFCRLVFGHETHRPIPRTDDDSLILDRHRQLAPSDVD